MAVLVLDFIRGFRRLIIHLFTSRIMHILHQLLQFPLSHRSIFSSTTGKDLNLYRRIIGITAVIRTDIIRMSESVPAVGNKWLLSHPLVKGL
jgi:hypothetical protein